MHRETTHTKSMLFCRWLLLLASVTVKGDDKTAHHIGKASPMHFICLFCVENQIWRRSFNKSWYTRQHCMINAPMAGEKSRGKPVNTV